MASAQICVLLLAAAILSVQAAFTLDGKCPDYKYTNGLPSSKFEGDWHIIYTASNGFNLGIKPCVSTPVKATPSGGFEATLTMANKEKVVVKAEAVASTPGKFVSQEAGKPAMNINIVDCDTTNYAVVIICVDDGAKHGHWVEIKSNGKPEIAPEFLEKAKAALATAGITDALVKTEPNC